MGLEIVIALVCFIAILVLGYALGKPPEEADDYRTRRFGVGRLDLDREAADRFRRAAGPDLPGAEDADAYTRRPKNPLPPQADDDQFQGRPTPRPPDSAP